MQTLFGIDNFKGMVTDVSDGKQPQDTVKEAKNLVYDRDYGSFITRFSYENSLARPTGVATLSHWLSFPVTYPSAQDMHLWFTEDGIFQRPYWHNSATVTDDWKLITEKLDFTSAGVGGVTITGTPTNTFVITGSDAIGFNTTANYYKNWVLVLKDTSQGYQNFFVKSNTYSSAASGTITLTLDQIVDGSTGLTFVKTDIAGIDGQVLYRYFHTNTNALAPFVPVFGSPAGYSTETGIRWSGGSGGDTGKQNCKSAYINKTFFNGSGASLKHLFTGTYIDQAECKAPASTLLKASTFAETNATDKIIKLSKDFDFNDISGSDWVGNGAFSVGIAQTTINVAGASIKIPVTGLLIKTNGTEGDVTTNNVTLASNSTYLESITSGNSYRMIVKGYSADAADKRAKLKIRISKSDGSVNYDSSEIQLMWDDQQGMDRRESTGYFDFTPSFTGIPIVTMYLTDIAGGGSYSAVLTMAQITLVSSVKTAMEYGSTYKLWGSTVYDKTQESELTYLGKLSIVGKNSIIAYTILQKLGGLNKFATAHRIYMSKEGGITDTLTSTTNSEKYLIRTIAIDDDATATWTFNTTLGQYEYADTINGSDWDNKGVTWEQKTKRTASVSTTCGYSIARMASGRVFIADEYDYAENKGYTNRVRFTGWNSDGAPTPDIFPNIQDVFITTITAGGSQQIKNLAEYEGDIVILKKSSILRLNTSEPNPFLWDLLLIKNGVGTQNKYSAIKFDKGLFFLDSYSAYLYDGYQVKDVLKGRWRNTYQSEVESLAVAGNQRVWYNPVNDTIGVAPDCTNTGYTWYEFNTESWLPVKGQFSTGVQAIQNLVTTSDGITHYSPNTVGANAFKFATTKQANVLNLVLDTGYYPMPKGKLGIAKWVYVLAELPNTSTTVVTLYGDLTTVIGAGSFTSIANDQKLYKFQIINDFPSKMLEVYISQTGTVSPATKETKIHKIWVEGTIVDEPTDITQAVTIT